MNGKVDYKDITLSRLCYYLSESKRGTNTKTMFFHYIYIHIVLLFIICPLLISLYNIAVLIIICRFESTLLLNNNNVDSKRHIIIRNAILYIQIDIPL